MALYFARSAATWLLTFRFKIILFYLRVKLKILVPYGYQKAVKIKFDKIYELYFHLMHTMHLVGIYHKHKFYLCYFFYNINQAMSFRVILGTCSSIDMTQYLCRLGCWSRQLNKIGVDLMKAAWEWDIRRPVNIMVSQVESSHMVV